MPKSLLRWVLYWYHLYLKHPGGSRLTKNNPGVFYLKGLVTQEELYANPCKICHQFKRRNTQYGHLPPNNIAELKPWDMVHVDLIGSYINIIRQPNTVENTTRNNVSRTCMTIIDSAAGWFEVVKLTTFDLDEVTGGNN